MGGPLLLRAFAREGEDRASAPTSSEKLEERVADAPDRYRWGPHRGPRHLPEGGAAPGATGSAREIGAAYAYGCSGLLPAFGLSGPGAPGSLIASPAALALSPNCPSPSQCLELARVLLQRVYAARLSTSRFALLNVFSLKGLPGRCAHDANRSSGF